MGSDSSNEIAMGELSGFARTGRGLWAEDGEGRRFNVEIELRVLGISVGNNFMVDDDLGDGAGSGAEVEMLGTRLNDVDDFLRSVGLDGIKRNLTSSSNNDVGFSRGEESFKIGAAGGLEGKDDQVDSVECAGEGYNNVLNIIRKIDGDGSSTNRSKMRAKVVDSLAELLCRLSASVAAKNKGPTHEGYTSRHLCPSH